MCPPLPLDGTCGWRKRGFSRKCRAGRCPLTPERWAQIEELFHRAAECAPKQRIGLLDEACNNDPELRREVEALLSCDETTLRSAPSVQGSRGTYPLCISLRSHASAILKSRLTVTIDTSNVCAISSIESRSEEHTSE